MADIYLIRHGEAAASWEQDPDPGLSERGIIQAKTLVNEFRDVPLQNVFSSPLRRAQETAIPLSQFFSVDIQLCEVMREIPSPANIPVAQRLSWLRSIARQPWRNAPPVVLDWRRKILDALAQLPTGSAVFTHFMVMNAVLGQVQSNPDLVCYEPDYCSVLALNVGESLALASIGRQSETRVL